MDKNISDKFLRLCKQNYFDKITPSNVSNYENENCKELVRIAKKYFKNNRYKEFVDFFQEGQYFVALWAAHLILEFGDPSKEYISLALEIITDYSDNPLAIDVAKEEAEWLKLNISKYQ